MTFDPAKYPSDWKAISHRIRFVRAGGRCEQCGVKHNAFIIREPDTANYWYDPDELFGMGLFLDSKFQPVNYEDMPDGFDDWKRTRVILTVHHIGVDKEDGTPGSTHDKMDCRDKNLIALCQRCHLAADRPDNVQAAKVTKLKNKHAAKRAVGQMTLFEVKS